METGVHPGRQVFRASWRSGTAVLAMVLILLAAGCAMAAVAAASRGGWALGALALFFGLMAWLLLLPFLSPHPVLQVDAQGIGGFQLRGHTVPWAEITHVDHLTIQGNDQIQLTLREGAPSLATTRRWFSARTLRGIPLGSLRRADRPLATQAALQAFHRHAGAQAALAMSQRLDELVAEEAFDERLRVLTPTPWALYTVMAVNVGVWLLNLLGGMSPMKPTPAELFAWGASSATAVVRDGEYWRLITATVLHGGVVHLLLNMYALWIAGGQVCRWFGNGQFLMIYVGSALAGSALSLHFSALQAVSVGASGAVFGVLGALLVGVYQHKERVPKAKVQQLLASQGLFVVFALVQGFGKQGIDNAAHVGGLLAGALMAWLLIEMLDEQATAAQRRSRQWLASAAIALVVIGLVWQAKPGVDHRQLFGASSALNQVLPRMTAAENALQEDVKAVQAGRLSDDQLLQAMTQRHIPAYRDVHQRLLQVGPPHALPGLGDLQDLYGLTVELMSLEVDKHQGRIEARQADERMAGLRAKMEAASARLKQRAARNVNP